MPRYAATAALALGSFLLTIAPLHARPAHKRALADYLGPFLPRQLNDCRTCHLPDKPGQTAEDEKPHNAFGGRLKAVRQELRKAGKKTDLADRLDAILNEDSDGDGISNLIELLAGSNPGDAKEKASPTAIAKAKASLAAFREFRRGYPWRPFEAVQRPPVPRVKNAAWVRNPIDAFVAEQHERHHLKPRPEAPASLLLRRLHLDLIGLPPTRAELHAFLEDKSPQAYEKVVDRLLASPQYGERWGRHWMDVWRYSDWAGYGPQVRDSQPHIWRWRDWIVESLNADKGYDRMVLEMLAADELMPEDPQALRATGYLVRNFKLLSRETWMQDTVEHTFMAFQGVTIGCAKCHDHMFDPILQTDYYRVRAIFEPHHVRTDRLPGELDVKKVGLVRAYDANPDVRTFFYLRGDDRTPDRTRKIVPGVPEALGGSFNVQPVSLSPLAYCPEKRPFVIAEALRAAEAALVEARAALAARPESALAPLDVEVATTSQAALLAVLAVEKLEDSGKRNTPEWQRAARDTLAVQRKLAVVRAQQKRLAALLARDAYPKPSPAKLKVLKELGAAVKELAKAEAALKQPLTTAYTPRCGKSYPATSTGRRSALARWLTDKENPLTARVAVNHVWLRHFGQALVPSVFDFGRNGRPPSHPALLDWLAAEFMERDWGMKALHRLIVTSSAYRMGSTPDAANLAADRDNTYLWRMAPRRVEAEVVRDSLFYVASRLDVTLGGPDINHLEGLTTPRRSLYFRHAAEKQMEFLKLFDAAAVSECYERKHSIIPQQALALANSELARRQGRLLARDLAAKVGPDLGAFVTAAFEQVLSRPPTAEEAVECTAFLRERTEHYRSLKLPAAGANAGDGRAPSINPALRAREGLIHVLLNHHEFVTLR